MRRQIVRPYENENTNIRGLNTPRLKEKDERDYINEKRPPIYTLHVRKQYQRVCQKRTPAIPKPPSQFPVQNYNDKKKYWRSKPI